MTASDHLLDQARLLSRRGKRPRSTDLKRATSTIYYALFHAVAGRCADALVGSTNRQSEAWTRVYRSLDHSKANREFKKIIAQSSSGIILQLAIEFVELQELRHYADYDPRPSQLTRLGVFALIKRVEAVLSAFDIIEQHIWLELATLLLMRDRRT